MHSQKATTMNHALQHNSETTSNDDSEHPSRTALVLGGGGSAGNAWLIGVITGLFEAGLDVTEADLIIGTSAGSTAAAQITSATPAELLANILGAAPQPRTSPVGPGRTGPLLGNRGKDGGKQLGRGRASHLGRGRRAG